MLHTFESTEQGKDEKKRNGTTGKGIIIYS
jgi:hypothetical protein